MPPRRSLRPRLVLASLVATALGTPVFGAGALAIATASSAAAADRDVSLAADALATARTSRESAERRHTQLAAELAQLNLDLDAEFAGAADLAADLEAARGAMRRSAVTAFINGGEADASIEMLGGGDLAEISGRQTFSSSRTLDWADAASQFQALKRDNDPKLIALTERREALASKVADATDAVYQAAAVEAEAERTTALAVQREAELAAEQAAAERSAASKRAQDAKRAAGSPKPTSAPPTTSPSATGSPATGTVPTLTSTPAIVVLTELSAPLPDLPDFGPSEAAWAEVRRCESGGNYRALSRSGRYRGAYQFDQQTWGAMGGRGDPAGALPIEQDARAKLLFAQRGARAWPQCGLALV